VLCLVCRKRIGAGSATEVQRTCIRDRVSDSRVSGSMLRDGGAAVKRRATWCPWSTDSDDDNKTTSNSTQHTATSTLIGGMTAHDLIVLSATFSKQMFNNFVEIFAFSRSTALARRICS